LPTGTALRGVANHKLIKSLIILDPIKVIKMNIKTIMGPYDSSGWFSRCQLGRRNQNRSGAV
jgi:hypothetical protein